MSVLLVLFAAAGVTAVAMRVRLAGRGGPSGPTGRRRRRRTLAMVAGPPTALVLAIWVAAATGRLEAPPRPVAPPDSAWCREATSAAERSESMVSAITAGDTTDMAHFTGLVLDLDQGALVAAARSAEEEELARRFGDAVDAFAATYDDRGRVREDAGEEAAASSFFELLFTERELAQTLDTCPPPGSS